MSLIINNDVLSLIKQQNKIKNEKREQRKEKKVTKNKSKKKKKTQEDLMNFVMLYYVTNRYS